MAFSTRFISMLRCQSLERVMAANGHYPHHEQKGRMYYHCPFHDDRHPSFSIEVQGGPQSNAAQRFVCPSCKTAGCGALELEALFLGKDPESEEVILKVCTIFGFVAEGKEDADFFSRRKEADPQPWYSFRFKDRLSDEDLEALGCQRKMVYTQSYDEEGNAVRRPLCDAEGRPRMMYSWGDGYYDNDVSLYLKDADYVNFDRDEVTRVFGLKSVESFVTSARKDHNNELKSYRISSSPIYPIFSFVYGEGYRQWGKKYEPYYRPGHRGVKFMFWYAGTDAQHQSIGSMIYGDIDVVNYLSTGNVKDIKETKTGHMAQGLYSEDGTSDKLFHHLVICSGPRDAISIYFHSPAHVVWFNSETADIDYDTYHKLQACCKNLYICYDIDKTGREEANRLAMKFLGLRIIHLPDALTRFTDRRTGKPGKDAENFFNLYRTNNSYEHFPFYGSVEDRFLTLMHNSVNMLFFSERWRERKTKDGGKQGYTTYEISGNSAIQLAAARNIYRYDLDSSKFIYVRITDNIVDIINDRDIVKTVRQELKNFVNTLGWIKSYQKLCDSITKSGNLDKGTCEQLANVDLNLRAWDADTEYFAFQNCVVRVTRDKITKLQYKEVPYQFFREGMIQTVQPTNEQKAKGVIPYQNTFQQVETPTFRIYRNVDELQEKRKEIDALMLQASGEDEREILESRYLEFEKLWGWKLEWLVPYEQQPVTVRFVYETGHIYWQKEKRGIPLSPAEKQEQDLHFIVKCNAFGYLLSRYRDPSQAFIVQWTDYTSMAEGRASGRTGKSTLAHLKSVLRNVLLVAGKEIKTRENFAKNFAGFQFGVQSNITIDDLDLRVDDDQFYNLNTSMTVKTLYSDEYTIGAADCPKVDITSNKNPRMDVSSSEGRFLMVPVGGPIGYHKVNGQTVEMSISKMFGVNIPEGLDNREYSLCQNFLMWCLQFYLDNKCIIRPFMGHDALSSQASQQFTNKDFKAWADDFFSDDSHFGTQLNRREMMLDFMEYCGTPISINEARRATEDFKKNLAVYCRAYNYVLNPVTCYSSYNPNSADVKDGSVRLSSWATRKDANGYRVSPKSWVWCPGERCVYVYRCAADIPLSNALVHRQSKDNPPQPDVLGEELAQQASDEQPDAEETE